MGCRPRRPWWTMAYRQDRIQLDTSLAWRCCVVSCGAVGSPAKHSIESERTQRVLSRGKQVCSRQACSNSRTLQSPSEPVQWCHRLLVLTGTVQVADIEAGWQKPLDVRGLTWTEPQELGGRQLASVEHIRTTKALLDIVRGKA